MERKNDNVSWLVNVPCGDINWKSALDRATDEEVTMAYEQIYKEFEGKGQKTKLKKIRAEINKREKVNLEEETKGNEIKESLNKNKTNREKNKNFERDLIKVQDQFKKDTNKINNKEEEKIAVDKFVGQIVAVFNSNGIKLYEDNNTIRNIVLSPVNFEIVNEFRAIISNKDNHDKLIKYQFTNNGVNVYIEEIKEEILQKKIKVIYSKEDILKLSEMKHSFKTIASNWGKIIYIDYTKTEYKTNGKIRINEVFKGLEGTLKIGQVHNLSFGEEKSNYTFKYNDTYIGILKKNAEIIHNGEYTAEYIKSFYGLKNIVVDARNELFYEELALAANIIASKGYEYFFEYCKNTEKKYLCFFIYNQCFDLLTHLIGKVYKIEGVKKYSNKEFYDKKDEMLNFLDSLEEEIQYAIKLEGQLFITGQYVFLEEDKSSWRILKIDIENETISIKNVETMKIETIDLNYFIRCICIPKKVALKKETRNSFIELIKVLDIEKSSGEKILIDESIKSEEVKNTIKEIVSQEIIKEFQVTEHKKIIKGKKVIVDEGQLGFCI